MGKSVVNPEFVAQASAHFAQAGFSRRAKGQRRMADLLPMFLCPSELGGHQVRLLGTGPGYDSAGGVIMYDHLAVTTPGGQVVPAYRRSSPDNSFNICQELNYVPVRG